MSGGLVVLGFLFLTFIFRSAIVGDIAATANERAPPPRARLPPESSPPRLRYAEADPFTSARQLGRKAEPDIDGALEAMGPLGLGEPRLLQVGPDWSHVRVYAQGAGACDGARGYLVGAFERIAGPPAKADEVACRSRGDKWCEFVVRHPVRRCEH